MDMDTVPDGSAADISEDSGNIGNNNGGGIIEDIEMQEEDDDNDNPESNVAVAVPALNEGAGGDVGGGIVEDAPGTTAMHESDLNGGDSSEDPAPPGLDDGQHASATDDDEFR